MADDWRAREREAQNTRTMPVWSTQSWWMDYLTEIASAADHFVHVAVSDPKLLAFTVDPEKGERDVQTLIKPGRYLSRYLGARLTEKEIAFWARCQANGAVAEADEITLHFADTEEEIVRVYREGPYSCMRDFREDEHPCRIYAAGDLAIAYLAQGDKVIARTLCWPERQCFGRVYPTSDYWRQDGANSREASEALAALLTTRLQALDYQPARHGRSFNGARLLRIKAGDEVVMPYLDSNYRFDDEGDTLIMRMSGEHEASFTSGTAPIEPEDDRPTCDRCNDHMDEDDVWLVYTHCSRHHGGRYDERWCASCHDNHAFVCAGFNEEFSNHVAHELVNGELYTVTWLEEYAVRSSRSDEWSLVPLVEMDDGEGWTPDKFDADGFQCVLTHRNYPNERRHPRHPDVVDTIDPEILAAWLSRTAPGQLQLELAA